MNTGSLVSTCSLSVLLDLKTQQKAHYKSFIVVIHKKNWYFQESLMKSKLICSLCFIFKSYIYNLSWIYILKYISHLWGKIIYINCGYYVLRIITSKKYAKFKGPDQDNWPADPSSNTAGWDFCFYERLQYIFIKSFFPPKI